MVLSNPEPIFKERRQVLLGPFEIDHPFLLAPMAGITNSPFRRLMRSMGSSIVISELVSANGIEHGSQATLRMLALHPDERIVGLQIFGEDEVRLANAARVVERYGADFVDLNLGCPVPKVVKKGGGAALCRDPQVLGHLLKAMVKAVKIPVTIKIRLGWDAESRNALEVVRVAADAGIAWVAIHGRTRAQGYSGQADWDAIGEIKLRSSIPIIGNGDVTTPETAIERYRQYGVDAVMIGRAALRNPFIFEQAQALWKGWPYTKSGAAEILSVLFTQRSFLEEHFDPKGAMLHSRKFLSWYASGYPGCHEFRKQVFSISNPEELWGAGRNFFEASLGQRDERFLAEPFLMGGHG